VQPYTVGLTFGRNFRTKVKCSIAGNNRVVPDYKYKPPYVKQCSKLIRESRVVKHVSRSRKI